MKLNKKGFTLIELLAVIVILAVLLAIAVPSVTGYINSSKKNTYVATITNYVDAARNSALSGEYSFPIDTNTATVVTFAELQNKLEKGGKTSPYGGTFDANDCVVIANTGTAQIPVYKYYVFVSDSSGYGVGSAANTPAFVEVNSLTNSDIYQLSGNITTICPSSTATTVRVDATTMTIKNYNTTAK